MFSFQQLAIPLSIIIAGMFVAGAIVYTNATTPATGQPSAAAPSADRPTPPSPEDIDYDLTGFPSLGEADAPVTVVEYSDYACPFCKRFVDQTKPQILAEYINAGLVRFVRKDFIAVGGNKAAEAAHCAGDQDAYWNYHNLLVANQTADRSSWTDPAVHRGYAVELGLDADALVACFEAGTYAERVAASTREGAENGGRGTPYFIIDDTPIAGAQPFDAFARVIEAELAEAGVSRDE